MGGIIFIALISVVTLKSGKCCRINPPCIHAMFINFLKQINFWMLSTERQEMHMLNTSWNSKIHRLSHTHSCMSLVGEDQQRTFDETCQTLFLQVLIGSIGFLECTYQILGIGTIRASQHWPVNHLTTHCQVWNFSWEELMCACVLISNCSLEACAWHLYSRN